MVVEAANAGPNRDTAALITAVESVPVTLQSFAGKNFNMTQFRTRDGGVEIGTVTLDASGNITARSYDPGAIMWTPSNYFNGGAFLPPPRRRTPRGLSSPFSNKMVRAVRSLARKMACGR